MMTIIDMVIMIDMIVLLATMSSSLASVKVLPIRGVSLGVHLVDRVIVQDSILLGSFNQTG
jgi:hypothetical protein